MSNSNGLRMDEIEVIGESTVGKKHENRGRSPDKISLDRLDPGNKKEERRGSKSNLLSAAGINYESRRRSSQFNEAKTFQEGNQVVVEDKDGNQTRMEIVEVREKLGTFRRAVPTLPLCLAILLCFLNAFLPGFGTLLGALSLCCIGKCRLPTASMGIKYGIIAACLQLLTAPLILGWVWSLLWGVQIIQDSVTKAAIQPEGDEATGGAEAEKKPPSEGNKIQAWA